ncbi:MAG: quinone-dependent dihydroorotate dehydrogenase [Rhizobiaceae bacterium]|nr:quinone-dependent dihydroorotate dehydrogenase [Rhizobiaceae bacterium]
MDAENAHALTISGLKVAQGSTFMPGCSNDKYPQLRTNVAGLDFPNPLGMAAGFDKNGEVPDALMKMGFGYAEIGTVTPKPQTGNPRPRIFRLIDDEAVINRLGFNNKGHGGVLDNLNARRGSGIVGVNIGANKDSDDFIRDYELGIKKFWPVADYFTANISSPNTPGLRNLQAKESLAHLLKHICDVRDELAASSDRNPPLFLKIAPDLNENEMDDIAENVLASTIDGLVISNTTLARNMLRETTQESGGLSGRPLFEISTIVLAKMRQRLGGELPIIGVGGIDSAQSAWEKIEAGANLLQLYTAMIYQGPTLVNTICSELADKLSTSGHANITALSGTKTQQWAAKSLPSGLQ